MKALVALDFDHTIIDDNSDLYVRKLAPEGIIPKSISDLYTDKGWTHYMGAIFKYLHQNNVQPDEILRCMREIPFVEGMKDLFDHLSSNKYDVIIISDSNSVFIDCIMKAADLDQIVDVVYTNPAHFDENGCLNINFYHTQDWCDLSTENLCKGHILDEHIAQQKVKGVSYDLVAYIGDGSNDLCPSLRLKQPSDLTFPRVGFSLMKKLNKPDMKKQLISKIIPWTTGFDIKSSLEEETALLKSNI